MNTTNVTFTETSLIMHYNAVPIKMRSHAAIFCQCRQRGAKRYLVRWDNLRHATERFDFGLRQCSQHIFSEEKNIALPFAVFAFCQMFRQSLFLSAGSKQAPMSLPSEDLRKHVRR